MENWKDIVGFEGLYQVSDLGRIRSLDRKVRANQGWRLIPGQIIKPKTVKGGYQAVTLSREQKAKTVTVHTVELAAFKGPRPAGMEGCHEDGDPANNKLTNLRYGTRKSNHDDKHKHGTMARGERINTARLTEAQVVEMRERRAGGETVESLAGAFGVSSTAVSKICVGDHWSHAGGPLVKRMQKNMRKKNENLGV